MSSAVITVAPIGASAGSLGKREPLMYTVGIGCSCAKAPVAMKDRETAQASAIG
jgi:hypothetical protein